MGHQPNRRRGVALRRFRQDLLFGNFGELLDDLGLQMIVGEDPDALRREDRFQAIHGLLDQGAVAQEAEHLFSVLLTAPRPKARPPASGQDEAIVIRFRH